MFKEENTKTNTPTNDNLWGNQPTSKIYNSSAIVENEISGINRVVKLLIVIDGDIVEHFKNFKLKQSAITHHSFELVLPHNALKEVENYQLENAQKFLGKRITVVFRYKDVLDSPERTFVGVVTEVGFSQKQGSLGDIELKGFSPTILLDAAPHTQSFGGTQPISLNSIVDNVIKQGINKGQYDYRVDSVFGNIPYTAQYDETHYNYLCRMAEAYGEQFFYDGEVLHFGKLPPQEKPIKLMYRSNINDVKIKMKAQHVKPTFYGYNSSNDEKLTTGDTPIKHKSDIADRSYVRGEKAFFTPSLQLAPIRAISSMDIKSVQKGATGSKAVDVFITSGTTTVPFLYPGCVADIEMRKQDSNKTSYFTKLMITEMVHEVSGIGYYNGYFEAIAADTGFLPRPEFEMPRAEAQIAKVVSNTDSKNQGRVQVQFDWQSGQDYTEFIRVMTPDAGSSEKVGKNRGFMSIPEVGDQVMVSFIHQHPDRPFVMGGMFHGKIGAGGGAGNNVKSFSSKSGNIVCLNDGAGIEIKDKAGNHVTLSGTGDINTKVSNDNTEEIGNNHTTNVTTKTTINVGKDQSVLTMDNGGKVSFTSATEIKLETGESSITMASDGTITISGKLITIIGEEAHFGGTRLATVGSSGEGHVKIEGGTNVFVKASQVDIN